jgi:hypothetical protein
MRRSRIGYNRAAILWMDTDFLSGLSHPLKGHESIDLGKERIVLADTHIGSGVNLGPPLPYEDVAGADSLPAESLDTVSLPGTVSAVSGTAARLFVCHVHTS